MPGIPYRYVLYLHMKNRQTNQSAAPSLSFFFFTLFWNRESGAERGTGKGNARPGGTHTDAERPLACRLQKSQKKKRKVPIQKHIRAINGQPVDTVDQSHPPVAHRVQVHSQTRARTAPDRTRPGTRHPAPGTRAPDPIGLAGLGTARPVWSWSFGRRERVWWAPGGLDPWLPAGQRVCYYIGVHTYIHPSIQYTYYYASNPLTNTRTYIHTYE